MQLGFVMQFAELRHCYEYNCSHYVGTSAVSAIDCGSLHDKAHYLVRCTSVASV